MRAGEADVAHGAVAALALHGERPVGCDRGAHHAAEAAGDRAGMAAVAGGPVVGRVERDRPVTGSITAAWCPWIALRQRRDRRLRRGRRIAAGRQRLRAVTAGAEDRAWGGRRGGRVETGGVVAGRRRVPLRRADRPPAARRASAGCSAGTHAADRDRHPAARSASRRAPTVEAWQDCAVHLVGDGQHDVEWSRGPSRCASRAVRCISG